MLTCPGSPAGRFLGRLADRELFSAEGGDELPQTRCSGFLAEEGQKRPRQDFNLDVQPTGASVA